MGLSLVCEPTTKAVLVMPVTFLHSVANMIGLVFGSGIVMTYDVASV